MAVNLILNKDTTFYKNSKQNISGHDKNTNFNGFGSFVTRALMASDEKPMIGVSIIDLTSMIFPRSIVDATRNGFAATETFLRESAGLIINCLIPSFVVLGMAKLLQKPVMGKDFAQHNPYAFWANENTNNIITNAWLKTPQSAVPKDKMEAFVASVLDNVEGLAGKNEWRKISDLPNKQALYKNITNAIYDTDKESIKKAADELIKHLKASRNIRLVKSITSNAKEVSIEKNLKEFIFDIKDLGNTYSKMSDSSVKAFNKKLTKLVKLKSFSGLAVIIALGASFQYFNRMLTKYRTGSSDFVGESDYVEKLKQKNNEKKSDVNKAKLNFHKFLGVLGMGSLAVLSFMKIPKASMFQFNGIFPTMDQCRAISAVTYSGRILSAANDNELKESALRDTCTFVNLYYLGDYVSKLFATFKEKFCGMKGQLLNETCALKENANVFEKFWHWFKNTELKGFEEIAATNTRARNNRAYAQAVSLLYSCIVLGLIVPLYNKHRTNKANQAKQAEQTNINVKKLTDLTKIDEKKIFTAFCK